MTIESTNGSLSFTVEAYEFDGKASDADANWLVAKFTYTGENGAETYRDACLLTSELEELAQSVEAVAAGREPLYLSDLTEPYLHLIVANAKDGVLFGMEFVYDTDGGIWKRHTAAEVFSKEKTAAAIAELKALCARFPKR